MDIYLNKPSIRKNESYSDVDFDNLNWHDVSVRSFYFEEVDNSFIMFLDYVLERIHPETHGLDTRYRHWRIPAILKFVWINDLEILLKWEKWALQLSILEIKREKILPPNPIATGTFFKYEINLSVPENGKIILPCVSSFHLYFIGNEPYLYDNDENYQHFCKKVTKENIDFICNILN